MARARCEIARPLPRQSGSNKFLPGRFPRRFLAGVEQSSLHRSKSISYWLCVPMFGLFGLMDGSQSIGWFISPRSKEGDQSIALSCRRWPGDDFERRLRRLPVALDTVPGL